MKTVTFTIKGMNCDGCARTIEAVVSRMGGVQKVEASFASYAASEARVLYEPHVVTDAALAAVIENAGFRVKARAS